MTIIRWRVDLVAKGVDYWVLSLDLNDVGSKLGKLRITHMLMHFNVRWMRTTYLLIKVQGIATPIEYGGSLFSFQVRCFDVRFGGF